MAKKISMFLLMAVMLVMCFTVTSFASDEFKVLESDSINLTQKVIPDTEGINHRNRALGDEVIYESEDNGAYNTADAMKFGQTVYGGLSNSSDVDAFYVDFTETTSFSGIVYAEYNTAVIEIHNSAKEIRYQERLTGEYSDLYYNSFEGTLPAGRYYFVVYDKRDATQGNMLYLQKETHTHSYTSKVTKKATCTTNGVRTYTCSCGDSYTQTIAKTGHKYTSYVYNNDATYTKDGTKTAKCDNGCGTVSTVTASGTRKALGKTGTITVTQSGKDLTLSWKSVTGATGYRVFMHTGSSWKTLKNTTSKSYKATGLIIGKTYKFAVRAYVISGDTTILAPKYDTVSFTVTPLTTSKITVSQSDLNFTLKWTKVEGATGYRVYIYKNSQWTSLTSVSGTSYTAKNLTIGKKYKYAVRAYTQYEGSTIWAPKYKTLEFSVGPEKSTVTSSVPASTSVKLTWTKSVGATAYYVYMKQDGQWVGCGFSETTSCTVTGLKASTKYVFTIRPYTMVGSDMIWSTEYEEYTVSTKGSTYPENITTLKASAQTTTTVTLKWDAAKGANGYRVFYKAPGATSWKKVNDTTALSYKVKALKAGTKYSFAVRPYNNTGSEKLMAKTYLTVATATCTATPELTSTRNSSSTKGKAYVYHTDVSGETGYTVYYSTSKTSGFKKYANFKANTTMAEITGLTSGKTYYFKVRTYITTSSGYVYSPWSAIGSVKVPAETQTADYSAVINEYKKAVSRGSECEDYYYNYIGEDALWCIGVGETVYYAQKDINSDGVKELIVGVRYNDSYEIDLVDIVTYNNGPVRLFDGRNSFGYRASLYVLEDGTVYTKGSYSMMMWGWDCYKLPSKGTSLSFIDQYSIGCEPDPSYYYYECQNYYLDTHYHKLTEDYEFISCVSESTHNQRYYNLVESKSEMSFSWTKI